MLTFARVAAAPLLAVVLVLVTATSTHAGGDLPEPIQNIVFRCSPGPGFDICSVKPDGSDWANLTNDSTGDSAPSLSPDGQKLAWERNSSELWMMNPDGTQKQELLTDLIFNPDSPTWSPSGQQLAFICNNPGDLNIHGICMINRNGSGFEMVKEFDTRPVRIEWSPVGTNMLVEIETQSVNEDIFIWNMQTDQVTNITQTPDEWEHGTWSPDGQKIAFVGTPLPGETVNVSGLYLINPDGSGRERLYTAAGGAVATNPTYSPDGEQIAYLCNNRDICLVDPDGGALIETLTEDFTDKYYLGADPDWGYAGGALSGDIDCTDGVSPVDSLKVLRFNAGLPASSTCVAIGDEVQFDGLTLLWGDIDCSGVIDPIDSLKLLRFDAGLSVEQEENCPPLGSLLA